MKPKITIVVVLYNTVLSEAQTLNSLIQSVNFLQDYTFQLIVCNNGPTVLPKKDEFIRDYSGLFNDIHFYDFINNKPLSILYNDILSDSYFEKIVFLDHDSDINSDFLFFITQDGYDIGIPLIIGKSDNQIHYPISDNAIVSGQGELNSVNCYSIGSGLIITKKVCAMLSDAFDKVFDENYALYGVDTSFFKRVNILAKRNKKIIINCGSYMHHDLSRVEESQSFFRKKERALDYGITARKYPSIRRTLGLFREVMIKSITFKFNILFYTVYGFFMGSHPRAKRWRKYGR